MNLTILIVCSPLFASMGAFDIGGEEEEEGGDECGEGPYMAYAMLTEVLTVYEMMDTDKQRRVSGDSVGLSAEPLVLWRSLATHSRRSCGASRCREPCRLPATHPVTKLCWASFGAAEGRN